MFKYREIIERFSSKFLFTSYSLIRAAEYYENFCNSDKKTRARIAFLNGLICFYILVFEIRFLLCSIVIKTGYPEHLYQESDPFLYFIGFTFFQKYIPPLYGFMAFDICFIYVYKNMFHMDAYFVNRWDDIYNLYMILKNIPFQQALKMKNLNFSLPNDPFMDKYCKEKLKNVVVIMELFSKYYFFITCKFNLML